ncbi:MAG: UTP--glucose-1-phosphate uridylyltransferase, partial [Candidatus Auribacterota bacterium]|nr:UTP--glucose-1-phosphate uridylyltransferase [Candidatus Auribacterota bacterium]
KYGFNESEFQGLQSDYRKYKLSLRSNLITRDNDWEVRLPRPSDTADLPGPDSPEDIRGKEIIAAGKLGLILMNGGAATRFQKPGENLPKGAFPIMEVEGKMRSFMELKLANARAAEEEYGGVIPVWILNSYFTEDKTRSILKDNDNFGKAGVFTYCQGIMKRVLPTIDDLKLHYSKAIVKLAKKIGRATSDSDRSALVKEKVEIEKQLNGWIKDLRSRAGNEIEVDDEKKRYNPPGHLDTTLWLVLDRSRPLLKMLELGVEYIMISNIDNLGALVDPALPGLLSMREKDGIRILCEVSTKPPGQKGGALARIFNPEGPREWTQIIEEFAFPLDFDQDRIPEFNNAAYTVSVQTLLEIFDLTREDLETLSQDEMVAKVKRVTDRLPVYVAMKELKTDFGGVLPVVQFERLQGDLTRLLRPLAVKTEDRFFPVKKREDIPIVVPRLEKVLEGKIIF